MGWLPKQDFDSLKGGMHGQEGEGRERVLGEEAHENLVGNL